MFLIKSKRTGYERVWNNEHGDNFLKFVPKYFTIKTLEVHGPKDLDVWYICNKECPRDLAIGYVGSQKRDVIARDGKMMLVDQDNNDLKELKCFKMKKWPYDEDGEFMGGNTNECIDKYMAAKERAKEEAIAKEKKRLEEERLAMEMEKIREEAEKKMAEAASKAKG